MLNLASVLEAVAICLGRSLRDLVSPPLGGEGELGWVPGCLSDDSWARCGHWLCGGCELSSASS